MILLLPSRQYECAEYNVAPLAHMRRVTPAWRCCIVLAVATIAVACRSDREQSAAPVVRLSPPQLADTARLTTLGEEQRKSVSRFGVFHDFRFTDRLPESGITYRNRVVSDAAKTYKSAHYDHGTGMAVADVDGDGRLDVYFVSQVGGNSLWRNLGDGAVRGHHARGRRRARGSRGRERLVCGHGQRRGSGPLRHHGSHGNAFFENDGSGQFRDITDTSGLAYSGHSSATVFFDYNRDGRLDLFLVNVGRYTTDTVAGEGYRLLHRGRRRVLGAPQARAGRAEPALSKRRRQSIRRCVRLPRASRTSPGPATPARWTATGTAGPISTSSTCRATTSTTRTPAARGSSVAAGRCFPRTSWGAMGIRVFDFDNDGRMDIFITDMHSDMSQEVGPEHEREKSHMVWSEEIRGDGTASIWATRFFTTRAAAVFARCPTP